jgi:WD40-like Beta Propeller Repeat
MRRNLVRPKTAQGPGQDFIAIHRYRGVLPPALQTMLSGPTVARSSLLGPRKAVTGLRGGGPRKILDDAAAESISPDGSAVAFTAKLGEPGGREIWLMDSAGDHRRKLYETDQNSWMRYARWSPDGARIAYVLVRETAGQQSTLESRDLTGGHSLPILTNASALHDFVWLPDGSIVYGMQEEDGNGCNYWRLNVDVHTGEAVGSPHKSQTGQVFASTRRRLRRMERSLCSLNPPSAEQCTWLDCKAVVPASALPNDYPCLNLGENFLISYNLRSSGKIFCGSPTLFW